MFFWGLNIVALKFLVENFPPITMTSFRLLAAGLVVSAVLIFQHNLRSLSRQEWTYTIYAALFGIVGNQILLSLGLMQTTVSNAGLILALVPLASYIFTALFLKDRLTMLRLIGVGFGVFGVALVVVETKGNLGTVGIGDILIFGAMLTQAVSYIFIKKASDTLDNKQMTATILIAGALILFFVGLLIEPNGVIYMKSGTAEIWIVFLLSAVFATGIGHMLYNAEVHKIGVRQAAIFTNLVPFFTLIGSAIFLGELIGMIQIIGFLIIVTGVILGTGYLDEKITNFLTIMDKEN
jgi:drug/metabolite transporter (DMT)-like permease